MDGGNEVGVALELEGVYVLMSFASVVRVMMRVPVDTLIIVNVLVLV